MIWGIKLPVRIQIQIQGDIWKLMSSDKERQQFCKFNDMITLIKQRAVSVLFMHLWVCSWANLRRERWDLPGEEKAEMMSRAHGHVAHCSDL